MKLRFRPCLLLPLALLAIAACASGSAIVTGTRRPSIAPEHVKIYLEPPPEFETIGLVSASSDAGWTEQGSVNYAIAEFEEARGEVGSEWSTHSGFGRDDQRHDSWARHRPRV